MQRAVLNIGINLPDGQQAGMSKNMDLGALRFFLRTFHCSLGDFRQEL